VPEQEYLPPRRPGDPAGPYRPDRDEEDPPPWADLPPVRPPAGHRGHRAAEGPVPPADAGRPPLVPPWAVPEADENEEAPRPGRRGGRAMRAAARKRRRWLVLAGGLVVVAGIVIAVVLLRPSGPGPAAVTPGTLITTFQPGELRQVPDACGVVPAATVRQYLPGKVSQTSPLPVNGAAESACNWTIDSPPVYRLMELNLLAYAPNGLASGDGSATFAAIDGYDSAVQAISDPPKHSPDPRATVTPLSGLGNQAGSALQVFHAGGAVTDVATVLVRYHNVVVTVTLDGLQHSNRGSYGPVSESALAAAALAFARAAEASLQ
jgi:hypothetical protein